jgi:hypothetical protein
MCPRATPAGCVKRPRGSAASAVDLPNPTALSARTWHGRLARLARVAWYSTQFRKRIAATGSDLFHIFTTDRRALVSSVEYDGPACVLASRARRPCHENAAQIA